MTATLQQTQLELPRLLELVRGGEEIVITSHGKPIARISPVPDTAPTTADRAGWLTELAALRARVATGRNGGASVEEILRDDRGE